MRIFRIFSTFLLISASLFGQEKSYMDALRLSFELLDKLEANTPFTMQDGEKYFGPVGQIPSLNVFLLMELGYLDNYGNPVKPLPKYSPLGELVRMNRCLFIQKDEYTASFFPSEEWYKTADGELSKASSNTNNVFIFVQLRQKENNVECSDRRILCFDYNKIGKFFYFYDFSVDGKSIPKSLGFYMKKDKYPYPTIHIKEDILESLKQHLLDLEGKNATR